MNKPFWRQLFFTNIYAGPLFLATYLAYPLFRLASEKTNWQITTIWISIVLFLGVIALIKLAFRDWLRKSRYSEQLRKDRKSRLTDHQVNLDS